MLRLVRHLHEQMDQLARENPTQRDQYDAVAMLLGDYARRLEAGDSDHSTEKGAMGYMTNGLTFNDLRGANAARLPQFKNKHGQLAHSVPDGSDWSPAQWLQAVVGELGEYANIRKKFERGDIDAPTFKREAEKELADVQTYLDILAMQVGVDLGQATMDKFNEVSERVGSSVRVSADGWYHINQEEQT